MDSDNSWSNILYILAIAVFGLVKYLFKNKSEKRPSPNQPVGDTASPKKDLLESLFGDLLREEEPIVHEEESIFEEESLDTPLVKETIIEQKKVEPSVAMEVEDLDYEYVGDNGFGQVESLDIEDFDLKKAVVYSEIINSKYC